MNQFLNYGVWCPQIKTPQIDKVPGNKLIKDKFSLKTLKESQVIISWEY